MKAYPQRRKQWQKGAKIFMFRTVFSFFVGFTETEIYSGEFSHEGQMES